MAPRDQPSFRFIKLIDARIKPIGLNTIGKNIGNPCNVSETTNSQKKFNMHSIEIMDNR